MKYIPDVMKFDNQIRSSLLIINMIFEIADLDPKLKTWANLVPKLKFSQIFMKFDTHSKSNVLNIDILVTKFDPKTEMCSNFYQVSR